MLRFSKLTTLLFILIIFNSNAGNDNYPAGARFAAMGNAAVSLSDLWSVQHNQAGLSGLKKISAGINYENRFLLKELGIKSVAVAVPWKSFVFALSSISFGYSSYHENKYGLSAAKSFGSNFSAGIQLDLLTTAIGENYGKQNSIAGEIGVQAKLTQELTLGAHVYNPTRAKVSDYNDERVPTILKIGMNYKFSGKVMLAVETEKDINYKPLFKAGIEYVPTDELYLRAGISSNPSMSCFGFGLNLKKLKIDLATSYHSVLGFSPQLGLKWQID
jgi:hypothetical protein